MQYLKAFIAGYAATLVFHQGVWTLFFVTGAVPHPPYVMTPTWPFAVPQVISLAFWGGVWAVPVWWLIRRLEGIWHWLGAILLGAIAPTLVALFVVFPLHHMAVAGGWNPQIILGALILNGAWGLGLAVFMWLPAGQRAVSMFEEPS
ncbi:MAG TPA: hypothetical protein VFA95_09820 [Gammaproteobacteria bacterium]|nr:hypothetical protein [Gammaproteobacteria bacterium]